MATRKQRKQNGSLHQRKGSPKWQGKFRGPDGKIKRVTLRTTDKAIARKRLDTAIAEAFPTTPEQAIAQAKNCFNLIAMRWLDTYCRRSTITEKRKGKARVEFDRFTEYFGAKGAAHIKDITADDIRAYFEARFAVAKFATIRTERQFLINIWDCAIERGATTYNIVRPIAIKKPVKEVGNRTQFGVDEFAEVLSHVANDSDRHALTLFFWTGCRKGELEAAQWKDIVINGGGRQFLQVRAESNKTGTGRKVLLTQPALDALAALKDTGDGPHILPAVGINHFYRAIRNAAIAAGWNMETDSVGIHTLRHSYCSHWANQPGIPLVWVRDWAGHSNIAITNVYVRADETQMDSVLSGMGY